MILNIVKSIILKLIDLFLKNSNLLSCKPFSWRYWKMYVKAIATLKDCKSILFSLQNKINVYRISLKYQACPTVPGTEMKGMDIVSLFCCFFG